MTARLPARAGVLRPALTAMAALVATLTGGCASTAGSTTPAALAGAPVVLIDGAAGLDNWLPSGSANWHARGDAVEADHMADDKGGYLVSRQAYANYRVHVEFWVTPDAKTGVFLRCADPARFTSRNCYEVQVYDQRPDQSYGTGALVNVAPAASPQSTGGHWNAFDITADGAHLTVVLNGHTTVDVHDEALAAGLLVLQYRGGTVRFRKVALTPL